MSDRPEYVKCIRHTHADRKDETWCGDSAAFRFCFASVDHAAYNAKSGRLLTCEECLEQVRIALDPANANGSPFV